MSAFDSTIGLSYLKAIHCNDSKGGFGSHRDLHQNIGQGELGLMAFCNLMADSRLNGLPFILETPNGDSNLTAEGEGGKLWTTEIALLYELERVVTDTKPEDWPAAVAADSKVQELFQTIKDAVEVNAKIKEEKKEAKKAAKLAKGEKIKEEADSELSELEGDL
jgi:AP endonuclease-1